MNNKKLITIVTPVFNEEYNLDVYYENVSHTLLSLSRYDFEIILVDDGSRDKSWDKITKICEYDNRFSAIRFSRNFGAHIAMTAGIDRANGDAVVILACDLQDPVETVLEFIKRWEEGNEIIWGKRTTRDDPRWRVFTSRIFNYLLRKWAMPKGSKVTTGSFLLIDRKVVDCFRLFEDTSRLTFAIVAWTGFKQDVVEYNRIARKAGASGWTFSQMITAFYNAILAYSTTPIKITTVLSIVSLFLCFPLATYLLYLYFAGRTTNIGWISTLLVILGFGGLILLQLSVTGEYLSRVYKDASRRPLYFVSDDTIPERFHYSRPKHDSESKNNEDP